MNKMISKNRAIITHFNNKILYKKNIRILKFYNQINIFVNKKWWIIWNRKK